ncbi:uncharacterized protein LOC143223639 isoform X2 [Tachypleus tridentatus]
MKRERELRQIKFQMTSQVAKAHSMVALWKTRAKRQEDKMRLLIQQRDEEMREISLQLFQVQRELKHEQRRIEKLFEEKDKIIKKQKLELMRFKRHLDRIPNDVLKEPKKCYQKALSETLLTTSLKSRTTRDSRAPICLKSLGDCKNESLFSAKKPNQNTNQNLTTKNNFLSQRTIQDVTNVLQTECPKTQVDDNKCQKQSNQMVTENYVENGNYVHKVELDPCLKENKSLVKMASGFERNNLKLKSFNELAIIKKHTTLSPDIKILSLHSIEL